MCAIGMAYAIEWRMVVPRLMRVATLTALIALLTSPAHAQNAAPAPLEPNPRAPLYQHTGEQYRVYDFPGTGESIPYRLFVPSRWKPGAKLPLLVTLRAGTSVDNSYREPNSLVRRRKSAGISSSRRWDIDRCVSPTTAARIASRGRTRAVPADGLDAAGERTSRAGRDQRHRSRQQGIRRRTPRACSCTGRTRRDRAHCTSARSIPIASPRWSSAQGRSSTTSYPFDRLKGKMGLMVIHGDQDTTNPIEASKKMADAAKAAGVNTVYATVPGGTHLAAYLTYASEIFDFLDTQKKP